MVQAADCGDLIRYIACLPRHVCINEVMISPTWNRGYVANLPETQGKPHGTNRKKLLIPDTMVQRRLGRPAGREDIEAVIYPPPSASADLLPLLRGCRRHRAVADAVRQTEMERRRRCRSWHASASATTRWRCRR